MPAILTNHLARMSHLRPRLSLFLVLFCLFGIAVHAQELTIRAHEADIGVTINPARSHLIFIWQANEVGLLDIDSRTM